MTRSEKINKLRERIDRDSAQLRELEKAESVAIRKMETRKKILLGSYSEYKLTMQMEGKTHEVKPANQYFGNKDKKFLIDNFPEISQFHKLKIMAEGELLVNVNTNKTG